MQLDKDTLRYVLDVAKSLDGARDPIASLVSRLRAILESQKNRLGVGDMARTKAGKFVVITEVHEGGYIASFADSLKISIVIEDDEIDFGGKGIAS